MCLGACILWNQRISQPNNSHRLVEMGYLSLICNTAFAHHKAGMWKFLSIPRFTLVMSALSGIHMKKKFSAKIPGKCSNVTLFFCGTVMFIWTSLGEEETFQLADTNTPHMAMHSTAFRNWIWQYEWGLALGLQQLRLNPCVVPCGTVSFSCLPPCGSTALGGNSCDTPLKLARHVQAKSWVQAGKMSYGFLTSCMLLPPVRSPSCELK